MVCFCTGKCLQICPKCGNRQGCTGECWCSSTAFARPKIWVVPNTLIYTPPNPYKKDGPFPVTIEDYPFDFTLDDDIRWYSVQDEYIIEWDSSKVEKWPAD